MQIGGHGRANNRSDRALGKHVRLYDKHRASVAGLGTGWIWKGGPPDFSPLHYHSSFGKDND